MLMDTALVKQALDPSYMPYSIGNSQGLALAYLRLLSGLDSRSRLPAEKAATESPAPTLIRRLISCVL